MNMRWITIVLFLLVSAVGYAKPQQEAITIWVDGVRLAGNLWKPSGLGKTEKRPAILMVHGWGGLKSHLNQAYAPQFEDMGYIVLTFDYRGWGESDGKLIRVGKKPEDAGEEYTVKVKEVRMIVDPLDQLEDIRAAHAYLVGESQVDAERLAVWGSSLGGGLALQTAATLAGFKVLITQIGSVNPRADDSDAEDYPLSSVNMLRLRSAVSRGELPPFPGPDGAIEGLNGFPDWARYARYDPFATADQLTAATLIIDAADEELFDNTKNGAALYAKLKNRVKVRYESLPGKHYDIYRGEGYAAAIAMEKQWLEKYLPSR
ncbi:MAG: alpha/beta fold hydrolase [bacterium]|nr:alpha/beta fold hydrolase [Gammaproteobacteria bacterium]HIL96626.1 alpha/beta fold hydrolase [Pseudomonadales bacterium]